MIGNSSQGNNLVFDNNENNNSNNQSNNFNQYDYQNQNQRQANKQNNKSSLNNFNELTESDNLNIEDINIGVRSLASNGPNPLSYNNRCNNFFSVENVDANSQSQSECNDSNE